MNKQMIGKVLIAMLCLLIIGCIICISFGFSKTKTNAAVIQNGEIIMKLDLEKEQDRTIRIDGENGYNIIVIENHTIRMEEASCPDKVCIHTGTLKSENLPIVCLPNKLIIRFEEE